MPKIYIKKLAKILNKSIMAEYNTQFKNIYYFLMELFRNLIRRKSGPMILLSRTKLKIGLDTSHNTARSFSDENYEPRTITNFQKMF